MIDRDQRQFGSFGKVLLFGDAVFYSGYRMS